MLQKIDRLAKPILKNTKIVQESLSKQNIFLEQENFDISQILEQKSAKPAKGRNSKKEPKDAANRKRRKVETSSGREPMSDLPNHANFSSNAGSRNLISYFAGSEIGMSENHNEK